MEPFEYASPATVQEAVGLLGTQWGDAAVLAGGTDQISLMKDDLHQPKRVVNIKNIKALGGISKTGAGIRIGATVTSDETPLTEILAVSAEVARGDEGACDSGSLTPGGRPPSSSHTRSPRRPDER